MKPPNFSSDIKRAELTIILDKDEQDLKDDPQDAATGNETIELLLSLSGIDTEVGPVEAKVEPDPRPPFGTPSFTLVVKRGKENFANHFYYE